MTDGGSSIPEVCQLLAALTATKPNGRIAEIGTAFGVGAKFIAAALGPEATFITVEPDRDRFEAAREALKDTRAELFHDDWVNVLPHRGPFDLIFFDGGTRGDTIELAISLLAPGGMFVKDDLVPDQPIDGDVMRSALHRDDRLIATEFLTAPGHAAIIATRR